MPKAVELKDGDFVYIDYTGRVKESKLLLDTTKEEVATAATRRRRGYGGLRHSYWGAAEGRRQPRTPNRRRWRLAVAGEDGAHGGARKAI